MAVDSEILRFEDFELDRGAFELRQSGRVVRLERIPLQLLFLLAEQRGRLVSREQILARIWGKDVFVDADNAINTAVRKVRRALRENPEKPRLLQTVPGKGYRFVASDSLEVEAKAGPVPQGGLDSAPRKSRHLWPIWLGVAAVLLTIAAIAFRPALFRKANPGPGKIMLAVLPFENLSEDPKEDYFVDGMTEEMITQLGSLDPLHLGVIARTSSMQYKGSHKSTAQIAQELGVNYLLEGSVRREGERVRVTAQLIQASDQTHIWAGSFDREQADVITLQSEAALAVAEKIELTLPHAKLARLSAAPAVNAQAHLEYLQGRFFWNKGTSGSLGGNRTEWNLQTAIGHFQRAIETDPNYGPAYAGLADAYVALENPDEGAHYPKETLPEAKAAATKALELDPSLGEAHFAFAQCLELYDWSWSEAEKEYKAALRLNPNFAEAHLEYGRFLQVMGRNDEAMSQMNFAIQLDPSNFKVRDTVAYVTFASGQYDAAIEQFKGLGDDFGLGWAYREKKMYPEAIAALEQSVSRSGRHPIVLASLAEVYGLAGRKTEALRLIDELKARARRRYVPSSLFALAYSDLGEKSQALMWAERAYEERDQSIFFSRVDPGSARLRSDPRFQALLRSMNFPSGD